MEGDEWIALATAAAFIGTRDAPRRIQRALMLGTVRARGVIVPGVRSDLPPEGSPVEIPASEFASLGIDCARSRVIPGERARRRVTVYAAVEVRRANIEALAREGGEIAASPPTQAPESVSGAANWQIVSPADIGRIGGKKSGEVRRAGRKWVPHATELAEAASSRDPAASNERIAGAIADNWKLREVGCPGPRTLSTFVSKLRASGKLPQRSGSLPKRGG